jgi:hypothetical protein
MRLGREDIARSLRTCDPMDARRLARRISARTDEFFLLAQSDPTLTPEKISSILAELLHAEIEEAEQTIVAAKGRSREDAEDYVDILSDHRAEYAQALAENDLKSAYQWADDALAKRGFVADRSSPEYRQLCRGILRVRIEATDEEIKVGIYRRNTLGDRQTSLPALQRVDLGRSEGLHVLSARR